ncbi:hypothetical protein ES703_69365 [subsurface metagenome]
MNNNIAIAFLALFGFIAVVAVGVTTVVVSRRGIATENSNQFAYAEPVYSKPIYGEPVEAQVPLAVPVLYENKEEWEIVRGTDRLIEKVVIHRMVTQNA